MVDAQGRQGGSTDLYTVSASDDSSCITSNSPGSTAQSATTASASASVSATSTPTSVASSPGSTSTGNAAVIGSSIAGGAVFLFAIASLVWFLIQRRQKRRKDGEGDSIEGINGSKQHGHSADLIPDHLSGRSGVGSLPSPFSGDPLNREYIRSVYDPEPYVLPPPPSDNESYHPRHTLDRSSVHHSEHGDPIHTRVMSMSTSSGTGTSKAQMAAALAPGSVRSHGSQRWVVLVVRSISHLLICLINFIRFILHTDAGEIDDDEVVELPPMYTQVQPRTSPSANTAPPTDPVASETHTVNDPLRS